MTQATLVAILDYYDGPLVVELAGKFGERIVGVRLSDNYGPEAFLAVPVEPGKLEEFKSGQLDLLDLLLQSPSECWYIGEPKRDSPCETLNLTLQSSPLSEFDELPLEGYTLEVESAQSELEEHAMQRRRLTAELAVSSIERPQDSSLLFDAWVSVQQAFNSVLESFGKWFSSALPPKFNVVAPALAGSVKIRVEANSALPDMFTGDSEHADTLRLFDRLLDVSDSEEQTLALLRNAGNSVSASYIKLLKTLKQNKLNYYHNWFDPLTASRGSSNLSYSKAVTLGEYLEKVEVSEPEDVKVQGRLEQIDLKNGSWRLNKEEIAPDKSDASTKISGSGTKGEFLSGLTVGEEYTFLCRLTHEEDISTGKIKPKYVLLSVERG